MNLEYQLEINTMAQSMYKKNYEDLDIASQDNVLNCLAEEEAFRISRTHSMDCYCIHCCM